MAASDHLSEQQFGPREFSYPPVMLHELGGRVVGAMRDETFTPKSAIQRRVLKAYENRAKNARSVS